MSNVVEHNKGFGAILHSTAELIVRSIESHNYSPQASACVLQSALLVEAAANCCIFSLNLPNGLFSEIDRLPALTKFDLFLLIRSSGSKYLDRGSKYYQDVKEIKKLRDLAVHPKKVRVTWKKVDNENYVGEYGKSERLGIGLAYDSWSVEDAITAFRIVNTFLDDYFNSICKFDPQDIRLMLLAPVGDHSFEDIFAGTPELEKLQDDFGIPLKYVGVGVEPYV